MNSPRVLMVGLEMGDESLILDWCSSGQLPVLRQLLAGGAWGDLESTAMGLSGSAWPTVYTGVMPGQHGVYGRLQPFPGRQGCVPFFAELYGAPSFWHTLDRAGHRCIVFDAPYTHPEPGYAGRQVFDWATWERFVGSRSMPRSLLYRLRLFNGPYPLRRDAVEGSLMRRDPEDTKKRLVRAARAKARAATWLLSKVDFDLFMVVFSELNPAGRYLWRSDRDGSSRAQPDLLAVYKEVDRGIGALLREIDEDVLVLVVSGDGVGPSVRGWHLLPEVLVRLGYLSVRDPADQESAVAMPESAPLRTARGLLPESLRASLRRRLPVKVRNYVDRRLGTAGIDWSHTRAFCLPTERDGYIRINLEGREPAGTVPLAEHRSSCRDIASALREMTNPATGRPAVREVIESREAFPGLRQRHLPDLIIQWSDEAPIEALESPRIGTVRALSSDPRPGTRMPPGFVLIRGPGVEPGWAFRGHIRDLAPTILTLFGEAPPTYMNGRSWVTSTEEGMLWA